MKRILFSIMAAGIFSGAMAIPAKPGFIAYAQPDGSIINIKMVGDEHGHLTYSEQGHLLVEVDGRLEYAKFDSHGYPEASGIIASGNNESEVAGLKIQSRAQIDKWAEVVANNRRSRFEKRELSILRKNELTRSDDAEAGLVPLNFARCETNFPILGEQKGLVILVSYQDIEFKEKNKDYFTRMLNEEGFSDYGSLGSARDWFITNSNGRFVPEFDVYGPVKLPNNRSYYGENDNNGSDRRPAEMVIDACKLLDDEIDFSMYDRDGNGIIDNVFIFYADYGEHDSGKKEAVWPHSWDISAYASTDYVFDGVKLDHYACASEFDRIDNMKRNAGIGTFVHEFSHVMGLPDLYNTVDSEVNYTPGSWSVMDQGPYNNKGLTPPNYSAWEKCALGWLDILPFQSGTMELPELSSSNVAYALSTDKSNEYFFFENRQQTGNDKYLPWHGMLVWHVDYNRKAWWDNTVNNSMTHQYVDLIEADNMRGDSSLKGDPFPGNKNVTSFSYETTPKLASWSKSRLAYDLEDIAESDGGVITFKSVAYEPNGVEGVGAADEKENVYFDLTGRRVMNPGKGIYIFNGKKVLIKD